MPPARETVAPTPEDTTPHGHPLTIEEAEKNALQRNPQITVGKLQALQAQQYVRQARSALLPQIGMNVTAVDADPGSTLSAGYLTNSSMYSRAAAGATASQLITDFGRTQNLVGNAAFHAKAQDQNAIATRQQIVLAVDQAFYNALETQALLRVAVETVKTRQVLVEQIQALTNGKLKSDLDLSFAKVDLARATLLLLESRNNREEAVATLSAVMGFLDQQDVYPVEPAMQATPPAQDCAPLIQQALKQRPEVLSLQDEVTASQKFGKAEHELWRPTVSALGVVGLAPARDDHISSWYGAAGVNVTVPVFNGFLFNARAKSADLETEVKRNQLQDLQNNIARDVRNGWLETERAYQKLSVTQQLREQASLALELAQARYKLGLGNIVEFSQAELQKTDADIQDTDAHYQYFVSQIVLAYQIGDTR